MLHVRNYFCTYSNAVESLDSEKSRTLSGQCIYVSTLTDAISNDIISSVWQWLILSLRCRSNKLTVWRFVTSTLCLECILTYPTCLRANLFHLGNDVLFSLSPPLFSIHPLARKFEALFITRKWNVTPARPFFTVGRRYVIFYNKWRICRAFYLCHLKIRNAIDRAFYR